MELSGPLPENLRAAIVSAGRLRGRPVHQDTLAFWQDLLAFAKMRLRRATTGESEIVGLIAELEGELAMRSAN